MRWLVLYTWALAMFRDPDSLDAPIDNPLAYAAIVAPTVAFVLLSLPWLLKERWQKSSVCFAAFGLLVTMFALARGDAATAVSLLSLSLMLIAVIETRATVPLWLVNTLVLGSIPIAALLQQLDIGRYGVLPGQAIDGSWRVSLFPYNVTYSWLFALVVLALNYFKNSGVKRFVMCLIALYFVVASGSRTGMIVVALCIAFLAATHIIRFRDRLYYKAFIPCCLLIVVIGLNASAILTALAFINNPIVNLVVLKRESANDAEDVTDSIVRTMIWSEHLQLARENPWIGHGTFNLRDTSVALAKFNSAGNESFLTALVARVGALTVFFFLGLHYLAKRARREQDRLTFCLLITFSVTALTYGSYIVPYDFNFLMLFAAMNHVSSARPQVSARP